MSLIETDDILRRNAGISYNIVFFHPDYTVGFGITPNQSYTRVAGCTAGRELHPAPKIIFTHYIPGAAICKYLVKNIEKNVKIGYYIYSVFYGGVNRNETTKEKQQKS